VLPLLGLSLVAGVLGGCGASPKSIGPAGIDELTIPTPSPDPADFRGHAQNPWFPLESGTRWIYRRYTPYGEQPVIATVLRHRRTIAGIPTTAVRWEVRQGRRERTVMVRWYAVDRAGDVWWFGQRVASHGPVLDRLAPRSWLAGRGGAEAGLILSATPREGDGYENAHQARVVERRSTVISLDGSAATPSRTYHHTVVTRDLSSLVPVHVVQTYFARGLGIVGQQDTKAISTSLALVRMTRGSSGG
jgi:hypothetical protein